MTRSAAIFLPSPTPSAGLVLTSLGRGVSSLGVGNLLARFWSCVARQHFFFPPAGGAQALQRLDHLPAGPVIGKSAHVAGCESVCAPCHGAELGVPRHV